MSYTTLAAYIPRNAWHNTDLDWKHEALRKIMLAQDTIDSRARKKLIIHALMPMLANRKYKDKNTGPETHMDPLLELSCDTADIQTNDALLGFLTEQQRKILQEKNQLETYCNALRQILNDPQKTPYERVGLASQKALALCKEINGEEHKNTCIWFNRPLRKWMRSTLRSLSLDEFSKAPPQQYDALNTAKNLKEKWMSLTKLPFEYANNIQLPYRAIRNSTPTHGDLNDDDAIALMQTRKAFFAQLTPYETLLMDSHYGIMPNRKKGDIGLREMITTSLFIDMLSTPESPANIHSWACIANQFFDHSRTPEYTKAIMEVEQRTRPILQWSCENNILWWIQWGIGQNTKIDIPRLPGLNTVQAYKSLIQRVPFIHKHPLQTPKLKTLCSAIEAGPDNDIYHSIMGKDFPVDSESLAILFDHLQQMFPGDEVHDLTNDIHNQLEPIGHI